MIYNEGYAAEAQPHYLTRAQGCRVWDHSGREMIDLALGGGSMILGHAHPDVADAIRAQALRGSILTAPHPAVHQMDKLLDLFIPWLPGRVWCNSGSEAVMRLCRIARAVTGKRKIGLFSGGWHGSWDGTLVEEDYRINSPSGPVPKYKSTGIPGLPSNYILLLPYRDSAAFSLIRENVADLACVLIEPVQGSNPSGGAVEHREFLHNLRHTCADAGVMLALDEVVTGFRLEPGGGQEWFGIHGDLAAYGKILGGGLPVGMVAGTAHIMKSAQDKGVFFGGTFSANPMTIAAGMATLGHLAQHPQTYANLAAAGTLLRSTVNHYCAEHLLPANMMGAGSISRLVLSERPIHSRRERDLLELGVDDQWRFYNAVRARGVHIGTNRIQFLSTMHGMSEIERVIGVLCESLSSFIWPKRS